MRLLPLTALVLAAGLAYAPAAPAQVNITQTSGRWTVMEGTTNSGSRICGVATSGEDGRFLGVRHFVDQGALQVQISKRGWSIPSGVNVPVEIVFHGFPGVWRTPSGGAKGEGNMLFIDFGGDAAVNFIDEFARASSGLVRFGGNEGAWTMNLSGSGAAVGALIDCIRRHRRPSQPYATAPAAPPPQRAAPTQPFPSASPPAAPVNTGRERRT